MDDAKAAVSVGRPRSRKANSCCGGCSSCSSSCLLVVYGFFAIAFTNGCFRAITIFMPEFIVEFESSATLMGWIFSIDPFMLGVMTPFAAYFTSKFGTRPVVMVAGTFAASGVLLLSQARHIALVGFAIGAVTSTTQATVYASSVLLIRRNFHRHYALAHGVVISGYSCGLFVFPPILEALSTTYSWRGTCLIASGIMFNTVLMGALMKPLRTRDCYVQIEMDNKAIRRPVGEQDVKTGSSISLNCQNPTVSADHECNNDQYDQVEVEEDSAENYSTDMTECKNKNPDLLKNGVVSTSLSNGNEMFDRVKEVNTIAAVDQKLNDHSQKSLDLDHQPSAAPECNADRIMVSGGGSSPKSRCRQSVIAWNYHTFVIYTLSMFSTTVGYSIFLLHVSTSFNEFGVDLKDIATGLSVFAAFNLIGRVSNGLCVSRGIPPAHLITLAEILAVVSIMGVFLCKQFPIRATAVALYGMGTGIYTTLFYVFHREIVDPKVDVKTLSIFIFIEGLAGPAGGALGGLLRDVTGDYRLTYFTSAGLSLFAAVLMIVVIVLERRRKRSSEIVMDV
nr:uncharacterized protein LOC129271068 [Lytechinus pictus]